MVINDATILRLKHDVLYEVVRAAWEGNLDEKREQIPYFVVSGSQATYHRCIYKEKGIIQQRVRLAEGKCPAGKDTSNMVQVINAACEEYPTASYIVTDSCRKCMGEAYQNSCNFGAISMGRERAYIEPSKYKKYGKCSQACPYDAVAHLERPYKKICPVDAITCDEHSICVIDEKKRIRCGAYIHSYLFGVIGSKTSIVDVIRLIEAGKRVTAMVAPATEGQSGPNIIVASWEITLKQLGFADMVEVGLGGNMTVAYETEEWAQAHKEGKKMTTSCCPAFVNMIKQHFPALLKNMSATVPPMCTVSRMIRSGDPDTVTIFIDPCITKKSKNLDLSVERNTDYAMTSGGIRAMMRAKGVKLQPAKDDYQENSVFGKRFDSGGGTTVAVLKCLKEMDENTDVKVTHYNGTAGCKRALLLMEAGKLPEDFAKGMACVGGCVGGPSRHKTETEAKKAREQLIGSTEERHVLESLKKCPIDGFPMHRH